MSLNFRIENDVGFIELDQEDSKVNLLTSVMIRRLASILDEVAAHKDLCALVIVSLKKDVFIAGADIKEIEQITEAQDGTGKSRAGQDVLNKLEDLKIPTIAVIDGVALGGGCELALACTFRLATFNEKVKIGLPEVNLGFIPGFGGTYRLPRVTGLAEGLKLILSGQPVDGEKALKIGLVDRLITRENMHAQIYQFIADVHDRKIKRDKYNRKKAKGLEGLAKSSLILQFMIFRQSRQSVLKLTKGFYPAPLRAVYVIKQSFYMSRDKGLALESRVFGELAVTGISKNLVQVFYLSEKYKKLTLEDAGDVRPAAITKAGVCGAGVMGGGIAQLLSYKGIWVRLKDVNYGAVAQGLKAAAKLYGQLVERRKMKPAQAQKSMARITGTLDYSGFAQADIIIEAVVEKMEVKKKVFGELGGVASPQAVLATNTSALSVTAMAESIQDPSRVVGFHFFNPVHRMPLVEVITTKHTSKATVVTALQFAKTLGKTPIIVKDACGFLVNRILLGYINEAGRILEECGQMERIDELVTRFGLPMGPFALSDEVGLDVGVKVLRILEEGLGERFKPVDTFEQIFAKGLLGKKSGKGFYYYGKDKVPNEEDVRAILGRGPFSKFHSEDFLKRMMYIMINEAALCLHEGIVKEPGDVDVGMIFGTGFPPFRGGLLRYADQTGIKRIVEDLKRFAGDLKAPRFEPCSLLREMGERNKNFYGTT
ncbi:MAG: hypothetical protein A3C36_03995 [Omnitrophica WOR_2 bacterium RIFCSPHIGHO2_02_FULL_52_10]|nr:MAG: hypothetical protein A3C36_03995 [Omnitrophica WOR_2 bacterium RIFCSPHIGHO2_02_FULL_52_10]